MLKKISQNKARILAAFFALLYLYLASYLMMRGSGMAKSPNAVLLMCILIMFLNSSKKVFYFLLLPYALLISIYTPFGLSFGALRYEYLVSLLSTNFMEGSEMLNSIPAKHFAYALGILPSLLIFRFLTVKFNLEFYKNRTLISLALIFVMFSLQPLYFLKDSYKAIKEVKQELKSLEKSKKGNGAWGKASFEGEFQNYVLLIGESSRKDFYNAYGYPLKNTPFLSEANGTLVDGLIAGGINTTASLRLMLTKSEDLQPNYDLTFVDLAKAAGLKTYWLSNQGFMGHADAPVAMIAGRSDEVLFKKLNYESKENSDFFLVEALKKVLQEKSQEKKVIVLHLYGSHPNACHRIRDYKNDFEVEDKKYETLSCYLASIEKTDKILKQVYQALEASKESFSMLYFADHGQGQKLQNGSYELYHSDKSQAEYKIPLFEINSNSKEKKFCSSYKSPYNFTQGLGNWLGIKNSQLDEKYQLFDCKDEEDSYNYQEKIAKLPEDKAINISPFLKKAAN